MAFDWAAQANSAHLDMMLDDILCRYGVAANVVHPIPFSNAYDLDDEPEYTYPDQTESPTTPPSIPTQVLLSSPVQGLVINANAISYADKIETQYQVTSKFVFGYEDRIDISFPNGKSMSLRVVELLGAQALSEIYFRVMAVVIGIQSEDVN